MKDRIRIIVRTRRGTKPRKSKTFNLSNSYYLMMSLSGKVAIVTGGTRGIGKATALALASMGASVAIIGRSQSVADEVAASLHNPRKYDF